jgi:hypothetical protein
VNATQRSQRARIAGLVSMTVNDPRDMGRRSADAQLRRFEREADPEGNLPASERTRRALLLRRAYFARLALASAKARAA